MIVVCPECSSRYMVADSSIGEKGRQVRCANCAHQWFQDGASGTKDMAVSDSDGPRQYADEDPDLDFEPIPNAVKPLPEDDEGNREEEEEDGVRVSLADGERSSAGPAFAKWPLVTGYGAAACAFLAVIVALSVMKETVIAVWPASSLAYEVFGAEVDSPGQGLIFDRIIAKAERAAGGGEVLKMDGTIVNLTDKPVKVPPIQFSFRTADGKAGKQWIITPEIDRLAAESSYPFLVERPIPEKDMTSVNLTFLARPLKEEKMPTASSSVMDDSGAESSAHDTGHETKKEKADEEQHGAEHSSNAHGAHH